VQIEKVPAVVIGAGVLGCAVAYELAMAGLEPWVFESGPRIAEGITARNSGVIHSGIYYPPASLKAKSCVRGQALLYKWCAKNGIPHRKTGKWIVAPKAARDSLYATYENARASGASGLRWVDAPGEVERELPAVIADVGLYCAESGIVDPYEYSRSFRVCAEASGAQFVMDATVKGIARLSSGGYRIETSRGPVDSDIVVNCAGLHSDEIAKHVGIDRYRVYPWRGDYFRLLSPHRFHTLVYPTKPTGTAGLGVHLTISLDGSYRLGPDVQLVDDKTDFSAPSDMIEKKRRFLDAARAYIKNISLEHLAYDSCGIRPKLRSPADSDEKDFILSEDLPGFVNLVGIESPGLTSAIDLAERVRELLRPSS
jgi:L-2-hydroxyglutarate oxidase LhgO